MELTTLSWMLLAADRAESVLNFSIVFLFMLVMGMGFRGALIHDEMEHEHQRYYGSRLVPRWTILLVVLVLVPFLSALMVPSSTVIMQVAAIELGEDVLNSDEFQRILDVYLPKEN